jgi:hypothetical protein
MSTTDDVIDHLCHAAAVAAGEVVALEDVRSGALPAFASSDAVRLALPRLRLVD